MIHKKVKNKKYIFKIFLNAYYVYSVVPLARYIGSTPPLLIKSFEIIFIY